jgi:hypothetical protein
MTVSLEAELTSSLEHEMLTSRPRYEQRTAVLTDDGTYYGDSQVEGWANAASLEAAGRSWRSARGVDPVRVSASPAPVVEGSS